MKLTRILSFAAILSLAAVGSASAAAVTAIFSDTGTVTVGVPSVGVKPSKNVTVTYTSSTAAPPSGVGHLAYSIASYHASGDKTFASSSGDTKIFWKTATANAAPASPEAAGVSAAFAAGWTSM